MKLTDRLKLRICTWNLGNAPPPKDLQEWLLGSKTAGYYDIIVVSAQEGRYNQQGLQNSSSSLSSSSSSSCSSSSSSSLASIDSNGHDHYYQQPSLQRGFAHEDRGFFSEDQMVADSTIAGAAQLMNGAIARPLAKDLDKNSRPKKKRGFIKRAFRTIKGTKQLKKIKRKMLEINRYRRRRPRSSSASSVMEQHHSHRLEQLQHRTGSGLAFTSTIGCDTDNARTVSVKQHFDNSRSEQSPFISEVQVHNSKPSSAERVLDSTTEVVSPRISTKVRSAQEHQIGQNSNFTLSTPCQYSHSSDPLPCLQRDNSQRSRENDTISNNAKNPVESGPSYFSMFSPGSTVENDILQALPTEYNIVAKKTLGQITILVFSLSHVKQRAENIQLMSKGTGPGGYVNKGAVGIAFSLDGSSFCFVNCHLPAHEGVKYRDARNASVRQIMRSFERQYRDDGTKVPFSARFDHCFWFGDLNYRTDYLSKLDFTKTWKHTQRYVFARNLLKEKKYEQLKIYDELKEDMELERVFAGFKEGESPFPPTFKLYKSAQLRFGQAQRLEHEKIIFNGSSLIYKTKRVPSYCDRILWRSRPMHELFIAQFDYGMVPSIGTSDHKPVFADFEVKLPKQETLKKESESRRDEPTTIFITFNKIEMRKVDPESSTYRPVQRPNVLRDSSWKNSTELPESSQDKSTSEDNTSDSESLCDSSSDGSDTAWIERFKRIGSVTPRAMILKFAGELLSENRGPNFAKMIYSPMEQIHKTGHRVAIRLKPIASLDRLKYSYVMLCFSENRQRSKSVCILELDNISKDRGNNKCPLTQTLPVTKYGKKVGTVFLELQLSMNESNTI